MKNNLYEANPAGLLCNYSLHLLYHMPNLVALDTYDVTSKSLRDMIAVSMVNKGPMISRKFRTFKCSKPLCACACAFFTIIMQESLNDKTIFTAPYKVRGKLIFSVCLSIHQGGVTLTKTRVSPPTRTRTGYALPAYAPCQDKVPLPLPPPPPPCPPSQD